MNFFIAHFKKNRLWAIDIPRLAKKLTLEKSSRGKKYYASSVLRFLRLALDEISEKTKLRVSLEYNRESNICEFKKKTKQKASSENKAFFTKSQLRAGMAFFRALSVEEQRKILTAIESESVFEHFPNQESCIFTFIRTCMKTSKLWNSSEEFLD